MNGKRKKKGVRPSIDLTKQQSNKKVKEKRRMKEMKRMKVIVAALLAVTVIFGGVVPAHAASAEVNIEVKATDMNVSVTVPTTIPIVFNEDGTNTYPTNWTVENVSTIAGIYLESVDLTSNNGWSLLKGSEDSKKLPVDTKKMKLRMGVEDIMNLVEPTADSDGYTMYNPSDIQLPSGTSKTINFEVERGAFNEGASMETAFDMVLTFQFS